LRINSLKTVQNYHTINFPVFKIAKDPVLVDGLLFSEGRLIDDTNVPEKTLGLRRLKSPHKISRLTSTREDIVDLIKDSSSTEEWYIDYYGKVIRYRKTSVQRLKCHEITDVIYRSTYSLIIVKKINFPIIVNSPPTGSFARILYFGEFPWKLYDTVPEKTKHSYKKV